LAEEEGIQIQPAKQEEGSLWCHTPWDKFIPDALDPWSGFYLTLSSTGQERELGINEQSLRVPQMASLSPALILNIQETVQGLQKI